MTGWRRPGTTISRRVTTVLVVAAIALVFAADATAQCAMCRTMLATPEGQKMIGALRSGILLLLAAPFAIFAIIATLAVRAQRRRRNEECHEPA